MSSPFRFRKFSLGKEKSLNTRKEDPLLETQTRSKSLGHDSEEARNAVDHSSPSFSESLATVEHSLPRLYQREPEVSRRSSSIFKLRAWTTGEAQGDSPKADRRRGNSVSPRKTRRDPSQAKLNKGRHRQKSHSSLNLPDQRQITAGDVVDRLSQEFPWFAEHWENESQAKKDEVLRILLDPPEKSSVTVPVLKVRAPDPALVKLRSFESLVRTPRGELMEKFGSRANRASMLLETIELVELSKDTVTRIITLANSLEIPFPERQLELEDLVQPLENAIRQAVEITVATCRLDRDFAFFGQALKRIDEVRGGIPASLKPNREGAQEEVSSNLSLVCTTLKDEIQQLLQEIEICLQRLCMGLLGEKLLSSTERLLLLIATVRFTECLTGLFSKVSLLVHLESVKEEKKKEEPSGRFSDQSGASGLFAAMDHEDRSQWAKGGTTITGLLYDLCVAEKYNSNLLKSFISTHMAFISSRDLLLRLIECYHVPPSHSAQREAIQLRVCIILKYWIESHFYDFQDQLRDALRAFLQDKVSKDHEQMAQLLLRAFDNQMKAYQHHEASIIPIPKKLVDMDDLPSITILEMLEFHSPVDIAKQLTIIDWELFSHIQPFGLLQRAWDKKKLKHRALPVVTIMQRLDAVSHWVASMILAGSVASTRAKYLGIFVLVSEELRKLKNFQSLAAITMGFNLVSLQRLKDTFAKLNKKQQRIFDEMQSLLDPVRSFKAYREVLQSSASPLIPYIGVYLSDLMFIDEGNPETLDNGLINFEKQCLVYDTIRTITMYQNHKYDLEEHEPLLSNLRSLPRLDGESLYELSLEREPRASLNTN